MKLISWNVNGLRACVGKGFLEFFRIIGADAVCLQETKLQPHQIQLETPGYRQYWNSAERKGYSGTAIFTRMEPLTVSYGLGLSEHDTEGRVITCEFPAFYLVTVYTPNAQDGLRRIDYRMQWDDAFRDYLQALDRKKPVIVCGDMNVAHQEIDLKNPGPNRGNAGFSDEEREKFSRLLASGFTDTGADGGLQLVELPVPRPGKQCGLAHRLFPGLRPAAGAHHRRPDPAGCLRLGSLPRRTGAGALIIPKLFENT